MFTKKPFKKFLNRFIACFVCIGMFIGVVSTACAKKYDDVVRNEQEIKEDVIKKDIIKDDIIERISGEAPKIKKDKVFLPPEKFKKSALKADGYKYSGLDKMSPEERQIIEEYKKIKENADAIVGVAIKSVFAVVLLPFLPSLSKHIKNPKIRFLLGSMELFGKFAVCYKIAEWVYDAINSNLS